MEVVLKKGQVVEVVQEGNFLGKKKSKRKQEEMMFKYEIRGQRTGQKETVGVSEAE